jgi:tRNA(Arg) A34 adenosine deaminase TadA
MPNFFPTNNNHQKFLTLLSKVAVTVPPVAQARLASAVVYKGDVVAIGINRRKTHPFQAKYGKNSDSIYLHSETQAILLALKQLSLKELAKSTLYICRMKYESSAKEKFIFGLSKPCVGCQRAIAEFGIQNVIYSSEIGYEKL